MITQPYRTGSYTATMDDVIRQPGRRIAVVGVVGCGKTTVAKAIAARTGIPYFSNDEIIHRPNWTQPTEAEEIAGFEAATAGDAWVTDGNQNPAKAPDRVVIDKLDTIVWLDLPRRVVFPQLLRRTIRRAWTQKALWHGNRESFRMSFASRDSILCWYFRTYRACRERYLLWMTDGDHAFNDRIRIHLRSRRQVNAWLDTLGPASAAR